MRTPRNIARRAAGWFCVLALWFGAVYVAGFDPAALAQNVADGGLRPAELLNSERIEREFGSYGITVLESGATTRVSNLYSLDDGAPICRTFAVVRYLDAVDSALASEHERILAGASIGAVFAASGWHVEKQHRYYGETPATEKLAALMRIAPGVRLAVHVYALDVARGESRFRYATIVEVHHPAYLIRNDLAPIYGLAPSAADADTAQMLAVAAEKMR